jgi:ABC-type cobalamin/Fe3+-siderophores transport system ATPase subunit
LNAAFELECAVLLLDEPWTALEPDKRDELTERVSRYAEAGHTVICSSHEIDAVARVANEVLFIGGGRVDHHRASSATFDRDTLMQLYREVALRPKVMK